MVTRNEDTQKFGLTGLVVDGFRRSWSLLSKELREAATAHDRPRPSEAMRLAAERGSPAPSYPVVRRIIADLECTTAIVRSLLLREHASGRVSAARVTRRWTSAVLIGQDA